jgi:hypothetical protein
MEAIMEEQRPMDATRRLLRVFGVTVTNYEERTAAILKQASAASDSGEKLQLTVEAIGLAVDLSARLRDINNHVLDTQAQLLTELKATISIRPDS